MATWNVSLITGVSENLVNSPYEKDHAEPYNNLGILNAGYGNLRAAFENFAKALKLYPNNREDRF